MLNYKNLLICTLTLFFVNIGYLHAKSSKKPNGFVAKNSRKIKLKQSNNVYFISGQKMLKKTIAQKPNTKQAKNIILFIADGFGVSTLTATRILEGQLRGKTGEENSLIFEKFPYLSLVKTYNTNMQTPDSAGTATALHSGIKTKSGVIGVDDTALRGKHATTKNAKVTSILELAEMAGMSTGVVSTTRITHATPATAYAHAADRNWEDDKDIPPAQLALGAKDIASQLIDFTYGNGLEVVMGGGRRSFIPANVKDPEEADKSGERKDGRNLTTEWLQKYKNSSYVWNKKQFDAIDPQRTNHLLALFSRSHMQYETERDSDKAGEPSLAEMTSLAIDILSKNKKGFYLMVEGGRVDHAHHDGNAYRALTDSIAFAKAVEMALTKVDVKDTLIIVTADHSHAFTLAGYSHRGNNILGLSKGTNSDGSAPSNSYNLSKDGKPYTTLGYANGPGGILNNKRQDLTKVDTQDKNYIQQATIPLDFETHSIEDVPVFAIGPWSHLIQNVTEQSYIFHIMDWATNLRGRAKNQ